MRNVLLVLALFSVMFLAGCGENTLDTSSDEAMEKSVNKMTESLSEEKKTEFEKALVKILMCEGMAAMTSGKDESEIEDKMKKLLDGKTVDGVIELSKEYKDVNPMEAMGKVMQEAMDESMKNMQSPVQLQK